MLLRPGDRAGSTVRLVFRLARCWVEAFSRCVLRLLGLELVIPITPRHSTWPCHRWPSVPGCPRRRSPARRAGQHGPAVFGQGGRDAHEHGRTQRQWRKLHLAVDADAGGIAAHALTAGSADDAAQAPGLLRQAEGCVAAATRGRRLRRRCRLPGNHQPAAWSATGRGHPATRLCGAERQRPYRPDLAGPPCPADRPAGSSRLAASNQMRPVQRRRDRHRPPKRLIGRKLRARTLSARRGEAAIAAAALNHMIRVARPASVPWISSTGDLKHTMPG